MTFLSWKARCVLGLLSALSVTSKEDSCIVRMSKGKIERLGNCQEIDKSSVLEDLRLKAQEASTTPTSTPEMTSAVTTEDSTVIQTTKQVTTLLMRHSGPVYDDCKTSISGGCFWTAMLKKLQTNFTRANETCASSGSVLAVIPDRKTYDEITMNMHKKLTAKWSSIGCWLGMTYDVTTGEIHPPGAFNETWSKEMRSYKPSDTNLLVHISQKRSLSWDGLYNRNKSFERGGAVCWKPKI